MTTVTTRTLTRTLWLRQGLVPGRRPVAGAVPMVGHLLGLQAQDPLPPYLALAARVDGFTPAALSGALEDRTLVRFFTLRGTVHVLTASDALALRPWVQPTLDRQTNTSQSGRAARHLTGAELEAVLRPFLADGPQPLAAVGDVLVEAFPDIAEDALRHVARARLPLLQVPPRGLWGRSGGVVHAFADDYLGSPFTEVAVEDLVLRYLAAYGPASAADMTAWSSVTRLGPVFAAMAQEGRLTRVTTESGRTLYDVPDADLTDEVDLPVTLLGKYDNVFLAHADRDRIAPEEVKRHWKGPNGGVAATLFVDGMLAGLWRVEDGRPVVEPFARLTSSQRRQLDAEVARVEALLATPPS